MKIIKQNKHIYYVVDKKEIHENDLFLDNNKLFICRNVFENGIEDDNGLLHNVDNCLKITHMTMRLINDLNDFDKHNNYTYIPVNEIRELIYGYCENKLADDFSLQLKHDGSSSQFEVEASYLSYLAGFDMAMQITKDKLFTINEMIDCYIEYYKYRNTLKNGIPNFAHWCYNEGKEYINSLNNKTEWDCDIIDGKLKLL